MCLCQEKLDTLPLLYSVKKLLQMVVTSCKFWIWTFLCYNFKICRQFLQAKEEMPPMEEPNDDLCEQIVQQVEFYFSDANITKDKFLLKHVKRNKEGFVSLKLISSFKRVKHLTKDWRQVAVAIERKSNKLEVNDLKTKVNYYTNIVWIEINWSLKKYP